MSRTVVLVPIRSLQGGKTRLAEMFDAAQRARLVVRMAQRMLDSLSASDIADEVVLVSGDPGVSRIAAPGTASVLADVPPGLNTAIDYGRRWAISRDYERLMVVFPDLPEVSESDLQMIDRSEAQVTIVADRQRDGTNALLLQGPTALRNFTFRYGPGSLGSHQAVGQGLGLSVSVMDVPGMATDLDTAADWRELAGPTRQWLLEPSLSRDDSPILALEHS